MRFNRDKIILTVIMAALTTGVGWSGFYYFQQPVVLPDTTSVLVSPESSLPAKGKLYIHHVAEGENLGTIAEKYHIDIVTIEAANHLTNETVQIGQELIILPEIGVLHQVKPGDTLWSLAKEYQVDLDRLRSANDIEQNRIEVGEKLFIPGGRPRSEVAISRGGDNRFQWPTIGEISSPFGYRDGRMHEGVDIANNAGTSVQAARDGKVTFAGWCSGYGYTIEIDHGQGVSSLYGHLSDYYVHVGQFVRQGQSVAVMGSTGNSTGPHLHFEVRHQGTPVNPLYLLPER
ncbi:murein DD-endopeptidase MepM/ murein hydrolase activator NlpD [Sporomusaceae bacterium BoRhaA]|uniref:peptidoglycan DD-metalloendopeptidase family protein n=1 Tax=Pelorhabdus rhamnosifermentans TaxID=2772457 RepID=UPI001C06413E|nr:M23 family metallopeptidase [Pelorhabdus rhamnosifermentans]MBU2700695.1 murein DD-endopeptidase MepM/ murein hydrolase activator NlpD [Pelorhabdus rhamnosifermentans]